MVQKEQFREDLLYRINTIHVEIPPLRERPEDIVPLTEIFITKYTNIYGKKPMALTDDAKEKLKANLGWVISANWNIPWRKRLSSPTVILRWRQFRFPP